MSKHNIDNKVVAVEFDNSKFDSRIKTSKKSVEDFDKTLEESFNPESFAKLEQAVDKLSNRFSTFGIVGMTVVQNLTTTAMTSISNVMKSYENMIKEGGKRRSQNIEQAKFQLNGLGIEWTKVSGAINYAVAGTAYSLDAAALAASNLAASGVKIDDVVDTITDVSLAADNGSTELSSMGRALGAISGVAAMTNSDFASIADIFSTVAGQGKLMTMQLRQLESRGMNAAAKIAEAMGKTEAEVRDMVTKGQIDFDTFAKTMYESYYTHAKDANKTVSGILANIKSAFSKIGANFYTPIIENEGALVKMLNTFKTKVDEFKIATLPVVNTMTELSLTGIRFADSALSKIDFSKMSEKLKATFDGGILSMKDYEKTLDKIGPKAKDTFENYIIESAKAAGINIEKLIEEHGSLNAVIAAGKIPFSVFKDALTKIGSALDKVTAPTEKATKALEDYRRVADEVINGKWGHMEERWNALTKAGYNWAVVQNMVNEQLGSSVKHNEELSEAELANLGYTQEQIDAFTDFRKALSDSNMTLEEFIQSMQKPTGKELLVKSLENVISTVKTLSSAVSTAWKAIFQNNTTNSLYKIIEHIHNFTEAMSEASQKAEDKWIRSFKGLFAAIDLILYVIKNVAGAGFTVLKAVLEGLNITTLNFAASIGDVIVAIDGWVKSNKPLEKILGTIGHIISGIIATITAIIKAVKNSGVLNIFTPVVNVLKVLFELLKVGLENSSASLKTFIEYLQNLNEITFDAILIGVKNLGKGIAAGFESGIEAIGLAKNSFFDFITSIPSAIKKINVIEALGDFISDIVKQVNKIVKSFDLGPVFSALFIVLNLKIVQKISALGITIKDSIGAMFMAVGRGVENFLYLAGRSLLEYAEAEKWRSIAETIKAITGLLVVLAGCVITLGLIPEATLNQGLHAIEILSACIGALILVAGVATKLANSGLSTGKLAVDVGVNGIAETIVAFAAAFLIIAKAMKSIDTVISESKNIVGTMVIMGLILAAIVGVIAAVTKISAANPVAATVGLGTMVGFAVALYAMVKALDKLTELANTGGAGIIGGFVMLTAIIAEMMILLAGVTAAGILAPKASISLVPIVAFILGVTYAITVLSLIPENMFYRGLGRLTLLELFAVALLAALKAINRISPADVAKAGSTMLGIAAVILAMSVSILILSTLDATKAVQGLAVLGVVVVYCVGLLKEIANIKGVSNAKGTLLGLSVLFAVLAGTLIALSLVEPQKLVVPIIAMGVVIKMITGLMDSIQEITTSKLNIEAATKVLAALTVMIGIVSATLIALSYIDNPAATAVAAGALSTILLAMAVCLKIINDSKRYSGSSGPFKAMMAQLILLTAIVAAIATCLTAMTSAGQTWDQMVSAAGSLALVLAAMTGCLFVISKIDRKSLDTSSLAAVGVAFAGLAVIALAVAEIIALMSNTIKDPTSAIASATALSEVLLTFTGIFAIFAVASKFKINPKDIAIVSAAFDAMVLVIGALFVVLGLLSEIEGFNDVIDKGIAILDKISKGLGTAFSNLIHGFMDPCIELAHQLTELPAEAVVGIGYVAELILAIAAASFIGGVNRILGFGDNIFERFGKQMTDLANGIKQYASVIRDIPESDLKKINETAEPLSVLVDLLKSLPREGGALQWLIGEKDLGGFGKNLIYLANGLNNYVNTIKDYDESKYDAIKKSAEALGALVDLTNELPNTGSVAYKWLFGEKSLADFAKGLPCVSDGIYKYYAGDDEYKGVSSIPVEAYDGITKSIKAVDALVELGNTIGDGVIFDVVLQDFGNEIVKVSDGIYRLWNGSKNLKYRGLKDVVANGNPQEIWSAIDSAATCIVKIGTVASNLAEAQSNLESGISATTIFTSFCSTLPDVAKNLHDFVYGSGRRQGIITISDDGWTAIDKSIAGIEAIVSIAKTLSDEGSIAAVTAVTSDGTKNLLIDLTEFGASLSAAISSFYAGINSYNFGANGNSFSAVKMDLEYLGGAIKELANLIDIVKEMSKISYLGDKDQITYLYDSMDTVAKSFIHFAHLLKYNSTDFRNIKEHLSYCSDIIDMLGELADLNGQNISWNTLSDSLASIPVSLIQQVVKGWEKGMGTDKKTANQAIKEFFDSLNETIGRCIESIGKDQNSGRWETKFKDALSINGSNSKMWKGIRDEFYKTGEYLAEGLAEGMKSKTAVEKTSFAAESLATGALGVLKGLKGFDSHSPSRKGIKIGQWVGEGVGIGIIDSIKYVEQAAMKLGSNGVTFVHDAFDNIQAIMDEGIDVSPTIRPVVDTSNVETGINRINGLFSETGAMRASVTGTIVDRLSSSRVSNSDVVDAINNLDRSLKATKVGNSYTIGNVTYDESSSVAQAIETLIHASIIEGRA